VFLRAWWRVCVSAVLRFDWGKLPTARAQFALQNAKNDGLEALLEDEVGKMH
jgi:hypothetical protein